MNWKKEAQDKLRRYDAMRRATLNLPDEITRLELDAASIRSASMDAPVKSGGSRREDALINNIVHRQELTRSLQQAQLWVGATDRALGTLNSEEKQILHRLYICPQKDAIQCLCMELDLEQSSIYRKLDRALRKFTIAYYGAE